MAKAHALTLDDIRAKKRPVVRTVDIYLDTDAAMEIARAQVEYDQAERLAAIRSGDDKVLERRDQAKQALEAAQQAAVDAELVTTFSFRSIGVKQLERLRDEHPPTDEQQKRARDEAVAAGEPPEKARVRENPDTFVPALIAAASLEPKITPEYAWEICHVSPDWNDAEVTDLYLTALAAQSTRGAADLGKSSGGSAPTTS